MKSEVLKILIAYMNSLCVLKGLVFQAVSFNIYKSDPPFIKPDRNV